MLEHYWCEIWMRPLTFVLMRLMGAGNTALHVAAVVTHSCDKFIPYGSIYKLQIAIKL